MSDYEIFEKGKRGYFKDFFNNTIVIRLVLDKHLNGYVSKEIRP